MGQPDNDDARTNGDESPDERSIDDNPQRSGMTGADTSGDSAGSPGGAVSGEIGIGEAVDPSGGGDLGGDADLGGAAGTDEDPLRTQTAGGDNSGGTRE
ncbi:MAG: hypothetical protein ACR2KP_04055 [Egibacteraceae bacterium]